MSDKNRKGAKKIHCKIGMTTDPKRRKAEWERKYPDLEWKTLQKYDSKSAAQSAEKRLANKYDCEAHGGGSGSKYKPWYTYKFNH